MIIINISLQSQGDWQANNQLESVFIPINFQNPT